MSRSPGIELKDFRHLSFTSVLLQAAISLALLSLHMRRKLTMPRTQMVTAAA